MRENVECRQRPPSMMRRPAGLLDATGAGIKLQLANEATSKPGQFERPFGILTVGEN